VVVGPVTVVVAPGTVAPVAEPVVVVEGDELVVVVEGAELVVLVEAVPAPRAEVEVVVSEVRREALESRSRSAVRAA
jgi:hypothetical protein